MQEWEGSGQVPSLLAERAAWEGPRSMRAVEGSLGHSPKERCREDSPRWTRTVDDQSAPIPRSSSRGIRRHEHEYFESLVCVILHAMLFPGWRHGPLPWTKHLFL